MLHALDVKSVSNAFSFSFIGFNSLYKERCTKCTIPRSSKISQPAFSYKWMWRWETWRGCFWFHWEACVQQQYQCQQHLQHSNAWPMKGSFVIPDEDEPSSIGTRTPTPTKAYPFMSNRNSSSKCRCSTITSNSISIIRGIVHLNQTHTMKRAVRQMRLCLGLFKSRMAGVKLWW